MINVNVEPYLSKGTVSDLYNATKFIPKGRVLRLIRIPVLDFAKAMDSIVASGLFTPFKPVIFKDIPVDMTENILPECVLVADDDTNISKTMIKETELFKGES